MKFLHPFVQSFGCLVGLHNAPPPRNPPGPVVATCPCCGKVLYCYGFAMHCCPAYPNLLLNDFPRVLGTQSTLSLTR